MSFSMEGDPPSPEPLHDSQRIFRNNGALRMHVMKLWVNINVMYLMEIADQGHDSRSE